MLFKRAALEGIKAGRITLAFRRWRKPGVKAGGEIMTALGRVQVTAIEETTLAALTPRDAARAGFDSLAALKSELGEREGTLYRIGLAYAGADPCLALRMDNDLDGATLAAILAKLARLSWALDHLERIARRPGIRAAELAAAAGLGTQPFKLRIRRLKSLGLTESLEVGYRLSPRGKLVLEALKNQG